MTCPTNEAELIKLFQLAQDQLGWHIVRYCSKGFPDAVIENTEGQQLAVEFEYQAKNFLYHGHDSAGCDLVICWHNNWPDSTVPIWALGDCLSLLEPVWLDTLTRQVKSLERENTELHHSLEETKRKLQLAEAQLAYMKRLEFKIVGVHDLDGICFYTNTVKDCERINRIWYDLLQLPSTIDALDKQKETNQQQQGGGWKQ